MDTRNETTMNLDDNDLFCHDLPTHPKPEMGKILVTGATGYIGGRLVPELVARGYRVRVMVRAVSKEHEERWPEAEIVGADALDLESLKKAFGGIHTAYYLIHSLLLGPKRFESADGQVAINFRKAAEEMGVQRIIYLGGLGDARTPLSPHLRSRTEVAGELQQGEVPVTILRAAIIIGSGSASYDLIKNLVQRMPLLFIPYWARTECQPISVRDVVKYLVGVLEQPETSGKSFDIGGKNVVTYETMLKTMAELLVKRVFFIPSFFSQMSPYIYIANLVTPVPGPIVRSLLEGIKNKVVCQNNEIRKVVPFEPLTFREAILGAMTREEHDKVYTRWSDAYPPAHVLAIKLHELEPSPRYTSSSFLITGKSAALIFHSVCRVGGNEGWFKNNWMWRLRGLIDRILAGVGTARGRRSATTLRINDVIDFWRVEDLKTNERLLLRAEMKLPGRAWLEFNIAQVNGKNRLSLKAHYQPNGLFGRIYWYIFLPFHDIIFDDLLKQIEQRG